MNQLKAPIPKPIVITASMFRAGRPRIGVTKSWLTNNHWVIHKSLLEDQLSFMTQDLAILWVEQHLKRRKHIDIPLEVTEDAINEAHGKWLSKGQMRECPEPWPGVWQQKDNTRYRCKVYELSKELLPRAKKGDVEAGGASAYCIYHNYYNLFKDHLTHMIYVPEDDDHISSTSLCNSNFTFILRPFRGVDSKSLEQVQKTDKTERRKP